MINLEAGSSPTPPTDVEINPISFVGGSAVQKADGVNQKLESVQSTSPFNPGDVVAIHNQNGQVFVGLVSGIVTDAAIIFDRPIAIDVQPGAALLKVAQVQVVSEWTRVALKTLAVGADTVVTAAVPNTTKGLMVVVRGGLINVFNLIGVATQASYFAPPVVPGTTGQVRGAVQIPVNGLEDTVYQLNVNNGNSNVVAIYATDNFIPHISQGQQVANRSVPVVNATSLDSWINSVPLFWDAQGTNAPAAGSQAKVVFGAGLATQSYRLQTISASTGTTGAVVTATVVNVLDGVTVIWNRYLFAVSGTDAGTGTDLSNLALHASLGASMTVQFSAGSASVEEAINAGAYLQST